MKIVINRCWGGFGVSEEVYKELGIKWDGYGYFEERDDPKLIAAIEKLGSEKSSGHLAKLKIVDIPDGTDWVIDDYDGMETVEEAHESWC